MADEYLGIPVSDLTEANQVTEDDLFLLEQAKTPKKLTGRTLIAHLLKMLDGHGGIKKCEHTGTNGLVDTYTITLTDGSKSTFSVTNGKPGDAGESGWLWIKFASQEPTEESHSMGYIPDKWIGICPGVASNEPTDWKAYFWYPWKGDPGEKGAVGATPKFEIGAVTSVDYDEPAGASISGTPENPVLSLRIPKGRPGADGENSSDWAENESGNPGYVRNRTHYVASQEYYKFSADVLVSNGTSQFTTSDGISIDYGVVYKVIFDGKEYFCRCYDIVGVLGTNTPALGNLYLLEHSFDDTGEPFAFYMLGDTGYIRCDPDYNGKLVTIMVYEAEIVQKLDNKYLDAVWTATKTVRGFGYPILGEREISFTGSSVIVPKFAIQGLENGATYTVTWNGTDYQCVCYTQGGSLNLGNGELADIYGGENVPFCFVSYGGSSVFVYKDTDTAETITAKIVGHREVIFEKIPKEFLPEYADGGSGDEIDPDAIKDAVEDYLKENPIEAPVQSVNGKTGKVDLTAADVKARPENWMPTAQDIGALPSTYMPPNQTAEQVGADPKGTAATAVSQHNTDAAAHNDLRVELKALAERINAFFDSDDQTLDELSEIVAYITSNKALIESITTSKVSVEDVINNLTTNVANKPLSAAQGVVLKGLINSLSSGKLDANKLPEAINTALAQAKESGEFDGENGDDYVLTDADKTEIAGIAAELVEIPESMAQSDWNASENAPGHILNRTHSTEREQVLAETTYTIDYSLQLPDKLNLLIAQEYTVTWNGVDYVCTAFEYNGIVCLGNISGLDVPVETTNEPFAIIETANNAEIYPLDGTTELTIAIYHNVVRKLDNKYLNLDWVPTRAGKVILAEQTVVNTALGAIDTAYLVNGTPILVYIDGVSYESKIVYEALDWYAKVSLGGNGLTLFFGDKETYVAFINLNGHTVKICLLEYNKIPEEYIPESVVKSTPQTLTDAQKAQARANIGAAAVGESSGSDGGTVAQSDWDAVEGDPGHILHRTHYKTPADIIFPEQTITFDESGSYMEETSAELFVGGDTYIVTWGGVTYERKAVTIIKQDDDGTINRAVGVGNIGIFTGTGDTGEPFIIGVMYGFLQIAAVDGSARQTVKIQKLNYQPLEREYLPKLCHVIKIPTDAKVASQTNGSYSGTAHVTDPNGEIIQALLNNLPVYLDISEYRHSENMGINEPTQNMALVTSWFSPLSRATTEMLIATGYFSMVPIILYGEERLNNVEWCVYVNDTD